MLFSFLIFQRANEFEIDTRFPCVWGVQVPRNFEVMYDGLVIFGTVLFRMKFCQVDGKNCRKLGTILNYLHALCRARGFRVSLEFREHKENVDPIVKPTNIYIYIYHAYSAAAANITDILFLCFYKKHNRRSSSRCHLPTSTFTSMSASTSAFTSRSR